MSIALSLIERGRDALNARYIAARNSGAAIEDDAFLEHLRDVVVPIVDAVAAVRAEAAAPTLDVLFNVSLQLIATRHLGTSATAPGVNLLWTDTLPALAKWIAVHPQRVIGSLSNAAIHLGSSVRTRPAEWNHLLQRAGTIVDSVDSLLNVGKIAAWRSGMVQYRRPALDLLRSMKIDLASIILGTADSSLTTTTLPALIDRLHDDPWLTPADALANAPRSLGVVAMIGSFRGFGGDFLRPPLVWSDQQELFVSDGAQVWQLLADCYGQLLVPFSVAESSTASATKAFQSPASLSIPPSSATAGFTDITSSATVIHTRAITRATSHQVYLLAPTAKEVAIVG